MLKRDSALILASASKRRSEILKSSGIPHLVVKSNARERRIIKGASLSGLVMKNSYLKASAVAKHRKGGLVLGADTLVIVGSKILGKPKSKKHAREMFHALNGRECRVYTGLTLIDLESKKSIIDYAMTKAKMKKIKKNQIDKLLILLGPHDKAGGFSIEGVGSVLVERINGCYFNILGLPMAKLYNMFEKIGLDIFDFIKTGRD